MAEIVTLTGGAGALHERDIEPNPRVDVLLIEHGAVVLGSTQSFDVVDSNEARLLGFEVVRRRSGGGVVILQPDDHAWIDVTVPRTHHLWSDDVERATWWIGEVWRASLATVDPGGDWMVHQAGLRATPNERAVCFASIGPGEVLRGANKVVGVSQRRTKDAARFQCTVFRHVDVSLYTRLLREPPPASLAQSTGVGEVLDVASRRAVEQFAELLG